MNLRSYLQAIGVPGIISAAALLAAWIAIALLLNDNLKISVLFAIGAFFLDSLDGYVARRMNKASDVGRQLDSMVDLIAYSVYAALLCYHVLLPGIEGVIAGYAIVLFGILRLIRFNTDGYISKASTHYYRGVVTCHLSLAAISFLLLSTSIDIPSYVITITMVALSVLQLSDIKTRKTGMLPFWFTVAVLLGIGAIAWLP